MPAGKNVGLFLGIDLTKVGSLSSFPPCHTDPTLVQVVAAGKVALRRTITWSASSVKLTPGLAGISQLNQYNRSLLTCAMPEAQMRRGLSPSSLVNTCRFFKLIYATFSLRSRTRYFSFSSSLITRGSSKNNWDRGSSNPVCVCGVET